MRLPVQPHCRQLAVLLDPGGQIPSSTSAPLWPETSVMIVLVALDGRNMAAKDFAVTGGWGHTSKGNAVMPGQGRDGEAALHHCGSVQPWWASCYGCPTC